MTSPLIGGSRATEIHANPSLKPQSKPSRHELILMMAIAASKAAAGPSHHGASMQAPRQLFET
jgi:hypothetical protein